MKVWFALVEIKPLNNNTILKDVSGAFLNVAYKASTKDEFIIQIENSFKKNDFMVCEIDEIETFENMEIHNPDNAEKLVLLNDIEEGYDFSWGVYHTYEEEE